MSDANRTLVYKIVSDMLDHPDAGVYPTTKCYDALEALLDAKDGELAAYQNAEMPEAPERLTMTRQLAAGGVATETAVSAHHYDALAKSHARLTVELKQALMPGKNSRAMLPLLEENERLTVELEAAQAALLAIADDGWLMHGEEGMSEAQEQVYKIVKPMVEKRAAIDAALKKEGV